MKNRKCQKNLTFCDWPCFLVWIEYHRKIVFLLSGIFMSTSSSTANNTFSSKNQIPPATCARTLEAKGENISAQSLLANPHSPFSLVHKKTRNILYRKRNLMLRISGGLILIAIGVLFTEKLEVKTSKSDFFSFLG